LRIKLVLLVLVACLQALFFGAVEPLSWWDGT
jgi:hypothetical protein